jgi:hypothetical protein
VCSPPHFEVRSCAEADIALHSVTAKSKYFIRRILPVRSQDDVGGAAFIVRADSHPRRPDDWQSRPPVAAMDFSLRDRSGSPHWGPCPSRSRRPRRWRRHPAPRSPRDQGRSKDSMQFHADFPLDGVSGRRFRVRRRRSGQRALAAPGRSGPRTWRAGAPRFRRGSPLRPRATYVPIRGRRDGAGRCRCRYWPARIQAAQAQFRRVKAGDQMKMTIAQAIAVRKG